MRKGVLSSWEAQYIACMNKANFAENMKFKRPLVLWHREFQRKIEFINPKLQKRFSELSTLNHCCAKDSPTDQHTHAQESTNVLLQPQYVYHQTERTEV